MPEVNPGYRVIRRMSREQANQEGQSLKDFNMVVCNDCGWEYFDYYKNCPHCKSKNVDMVESEG
jgi:predicted Zn-ribbon and HTH transcriptional regulator